MRPCPACQSVSAHAQGARNGFELMRCDRCATLFTARLPRTEEENEDYSTYYDEGNLSAPAFVEQQLDELVSGFERYRDRNRWLDVGCGAGTLMQAAARRGWTAVGTEVAARAADVVRARGFDVRVGELQSLGLEPGSFDVVSVVEVIEHVPDPGALLGAAAQTLRAGGALYVTTPHGRGISARLLRNGWSVITPPEHLQLFSITGLRTLLALAGLRVTEVHTHAVNPYELLSAVRRNAHAEEPVDRVATGYRLNESLSGSAAGRLAKATVNAALSALRLGDTLKVTARAPG